MKTNVTIADVARVAGVSTSTVSHVVNGTRWVNPETADGVRDAIKATGYRPNTLARSLARKSGSIIGIALSISANPFFSEVATAIEKACAELGLMVVLADTEEEPGRELEVVKALHGMQVAGIILAPCTSCVSRSVEYLADHDVPTVLVDRLAANSTFDFVGSENTLSIARLVERLVVLGHRRIGMVAGQADFSSSIERVAGYRRGLEQAGLSFDASLVVDGCTDLEAAIASVSTMLDRADLPTAIVGGNNLSTVAIVAASRRKGLAIPRQLSVVGFDDFEWSDYFEPRLTLMAQPWTEIGRRATMLLFERVKGVKADSQIVRLDPELKARDSIAEV